MLVSSGFVGNIHYIISACKTIASRLNYKSADVTTLFRFRHAAEYGNCGEVCGDVYGGTKLSFYTDLESGSGLSPEKIRTVYKGSRGESRLQS